MFTILISIFGFSVLLYALAPDANNADSEGYLWGGPDDGWQAGSARSIFLSDDNDFSDSSSSSSWSSSDSWHDTGPSVNIDGSPMVGSVDINGNPYGATDSSWSNDSWSHHDLFSSSDSYSDSCSTGGHDW